MATTVAGLNKRMKRWAKELGQSCELNPDETRTARVKNANMAFAPFGSWLRWDECRKALFSTKREEIEAGLQTVDSWKRRAGSATLFVEATAGLLRAKLFDESHAMSGAGSDSHPDIISSVYAMALLRMVNTCTDSQPVVESRHGRTSVKQRALAAGLPVELVVLRHSATHKALPSLQELRICTALGLKYLWDTYWMKQLAAIATQLDLEKSEAGREGAGDTSSSRVPTAAELCAAFGLPVDVLPADRMLVPDVGAPPPPAPSSEKKMKKKGRGGQGGVGDNVDDNDDDADRGDDRRKVGTKGWHVPSEYPKQAFV
eukprot:PhM_4_TR3617/c0_g1_i1/m.94466/K16912/LAS1; ribosomal biogenesis protein LAS1